MAYHYNQYFKWKSFRLSGYCFVNPTVNQHDSWENFLRNDKLAHESRLVRQLHITCDYSKPWLILLS